MLIMSLTLIGCNLLLTIILNLRKYICVAIKQNGVWTRVHHIFSLLLGVMLHSKSYILQKTQLKLDKSLQSYDLWKGCQNKRKWRDLFPLFGSISKSKFANSNSFCLIHHILSISNHSHWTTRDANHWLIAVNSMVTLSHLLFECDGCVIIQY